MTAVLATRFSRLTPRDYLRIEPGCRCFHAMSGRFLNLVDLLACCRSPAECLKVENRMWLSRLFRKPVEYLKSGFPVPHFPRNP